MGSLLASARHAFIRGILLLLPLAITWVILRWIFTTITGISEGPAGRLIASLGERAMLGPVHPLTVTLLGLILTVALVLAIGIIGGNYVGRLLWGYFERLLLRLPFVRWFYGSARQLIDAFSMGGTGAFREVVMVEYPRRGVWCLGFVTATVAGPPPKGADEECVYVFLPTTPIPTSGYTIILPRSEARPTSMSIDDGLKLIVSGGFIAPKGRAAGAPATAP